MTQRSCLLPRLAVPVLQTTDLAGSIAWYVNVLGFHVAQRVPHVVALLRLGSVRLQLWQVPDAQPQDCCIPLDARQADIFQCHTRIARNARNWVAPSPTLRPWGAWEFCVMDPHGHQLRFVQWAADPLPEEEQQPRTEGRQAWKGE
jgi:hypothetical protein